jgi:hypothetical protein
MADLRFEECDAYHRMKFRGLPDRTYSTSVGVIKVIHGDEMSIIVPTVDGYDCEDVNTEIYPNEAAFLMHFSWIHIK